MRDQDTCDVCGREYRYCACLSDASPLPAGTNTFGEWSSFLERLERERPPHTSVERLPDGSTRVTFGPISQGR